MTLVHMPYVVHALGNAMFTCEWCVFSDRWTPKGQLIAHIHEHKSSVNR